MMIRRKKCFYDVFLQNKIINLNISGHYVHIISDISQWAYSQNSTSDKLCFAKINIYIFSSKSTPRITLFFVKCTSEIYLWYALTIKTCFYVGYRKPKNK